MKIRSFLLTASLPIVCLLAFCPRPAVAFIMYTPPTLGNLCRQATHIYVLRVDESLIVKRLALNPMGKRVTVQSDNPAYPDWPDCGLDEIQSIGRVIWSGRKIV